MNLKTPVWAAKSILASFLLGLTPGISVAAETVGEAFDLASNELLYRETHCVDETGEARDVIYRNVDGELIAVKRVDYRSGRITPSFEQQNLYSSETIRVELDDGMLTMAILDSANAEPKKVKSTAPTGEIPVVIDAGFDEFVRAHWDQLLEGDDKTFLFPFASRASLVKLQISPTACSYATETDQCFQLEMSNWLFRMLAAPIELGYDPATRRLTRYRGLSNIGDGSGGGQEVDIQYRYSDLPALACEALPAPSTSQVKLDSAPGKGEG